MPYTFTCDGWCAGLAIKGIKDVVGYPIET